LLIRPPSSGDIPRHRPARTPGSSAPVPPGGSLGPGDSGDSGTRSGRWRQRPRHRCGGLTYRPWSLADATRPANSMSSLASTCSPRAVASPASFPHASRNAGMALGNSTVGATSTAPSPPKVSTPVAFSAPAVTESGAPVVRGGGTWKVEGRDAPVSRETSRPSESGRQDLKATPNPYPRPVFRGLRWDFTGLGRCLPMVEGALRGLSSVRSDRFRNVAFARATGLEEGGLA
jgi:hypothetical protein